MPATLKRVEPLHAPIVPPQGAVAAGITPDGRQLYSMTRKRSRSVPKLDANKQEVWRKHATTGEPMYQLRRPEAYSEELLFTIESEGNGNNRMVPFAWPTEEEKAETRRNQAIAEMQGGLARALVDRGFTPEKLLDAIAALDRPVVGTPVPVSAAVQTVATVSEVPAELEAPVLYPVKDENSNWWTLSNKQRVQGEKLARESEARIHEVKSESVPEV